MAEAKQKSLSPKEAIGAKDVCSENAAIRTIYVGLNNQTDWFCKIALFQLLDESNLVPNGFITDTGTFVGVLNAPGPSTIGIDPCYAGGGPKLIQATRGKCAAVFTKGNEELHIDFNDASDGDVTTYYASITFLLSYGPAGKPVAQLTKRKKGE